MKIEELVSDENDISSIPPMSMDATRSLDLTIRSKSPIAAPVSRHFFQSNSYQSLVLRIRTTPNAVAADRIGSVVHVNISPHTKSYTHQYDVHPLPLSPRPLATHLTFRLATPSSPPQLTLTLRKKPILLRFRIPVSKTPLWDKRLRAFPPEIRDMIFEWMLRNSWNGRTPNLIKALRSSKRYSYLYYEAMYAFYKTNCYSLNHRNGWCFGDMNGRLLSKIRVLGIDIGYPNLNYHWPKLISTFHHPRVAQNLRFHTLHLTDTLPTLPTLPATTIPSTSLSAITAPTPTPTPTPTPNTTTHRRAIRNHNISVLLRHFVIMPGSRPGFVQRRRGLERVFLNTQLEPDLVAPLIAKLDFRFRKRPKLLAVSTGYERLVWFWDVRRGDEKRAREGGLPDDVEWFERWAGMATYE